MCLLAKDTSAIFSTEIFILRDGERCKRGQERSSGYTGAFWVDTELLLTLIIDMYTILTSVFCRKCCVKAQAEPQF